MISGKSEAQEGYSDNGNVAQVPANSITYIYDGNIDELWRLTNDEVQVIMSPTD